MSSRGLRNRNPGNIRRSKTRYMGEVPSNDTAFKSFASMAWGYRAMFVVLHTYQHRYGLNTPEALLARYAPASENDTAAYIAAVARQSSTAPDQPLDTLHGDTMIPLVAAMSRVENGVAADMEEVRSGWNLFITHRP